MIKAKFSAQVNKTQSFFVWRNIRSLHCATPLENEDKIFSLLWEVAILSKRVIHGFAAHRLRPLEAVTLHDSEWSKISQIPLSTSVARIEAAAQETKIMPYGLLFRRLPKKIPTVAIKDSVTILYLPFYFTYFTYRIHLLTPTEGGTEALASISEVTVMIAVSRLCTSLKEFDSIQQHFIPMSLWEWRIKADHAFGSIMPKYLEFIISSW